MIDHGDQVHVDSDDAGHSVVLRITERLSGEMVIVDGRKYIIEIIDAVNGGIEIVATPVVYRQAD